MAARQTKKKAASKREASDEGVGSSQRSLDERVDLNLKIFAEMRARRAKRQKKVQSEFKEETEKAIEELRVDTVSKFRKHLDDITNMHNIFRQEQVTIQAEIRELWVEVAKTHCKFMATCQEQLDASEGVSEERKDRFLKALSMQSRAVKDHEKAINMLK